MGRTEARLNLIVVKPFSSFPFGRKGLYYPDLESSAYCKFQTEQEANLMFMACIGLVLFATALYVVLTGRLGARPIARKHGGWGALLGVVVFLVGVIQLAQADSAARKADTNTSPQAMAPEAPKVSAEEIMAHLKEGFQDTNWFGNVQKLEVHQNAISTQFIIYANLFPKDSNSELAKSICRGVAINGGLKIGTTDVQASVRGQGESTLAGCDVGVENGKVTKPLTFR